MSTPLTPATITRLEKAAADNGFDQELPRVEGWLAFASTQAPLRLWLTATAEGQFIAALSQANVARALSDHGAAFAGGLPPSATGALVVSDIPALHHLVRRAFQLSRSLPDELLHTFERRAATLPRATEAERLVVQRVGQDIFRSGLLDYWEGRCAVTGLDVPELLRASHMKPWADCATDAERLDVFNGLLLAPHLDVLFDRGFITFGENGTAVVAAALTPEHRNALGLVAPFGIATLSPRHEPYLAWHRQRCFRDARGR